MNHDLFASSHEEYFELPDAEMSITRSFYSPSEADQIFKKLQTELDRQQQEIRFNDKATKLPRLTAFLGDTGTRYQYSGISSRATPWSPTISKMRERVESQSATKFNCVLLNYYRNGGDHMSWHADDEHELGPTPVIGSVSLGESRRFQLKHKIHSTLRFELQLNHGDYLVMEGKTQQYWYHRVPPQPHFSQARINLTFRRVLNAEF